MDPDVAAGLLLELGDEVRGAEIRCYMRDPDGYMIEVGQSTGRLAGKLAKKRPGDLPG